MIESMVKPRLLCVGCGDLGSAVGQELADQGWQVWGMRRTPDKLPAKIDPVSGDVVTGEGLDRIAGMAPDVVLITLTPGVFSEEAYRRIFVEGLQNLLSALAGCSPRCVLFTSSTSVYHQQDGSWVDESSPTEPRGFSGRVLLEAERILAGSGLPATCLRLGGIYGPGRDRLLRQVRAGLRHPQRLESVSNRIHRDDVIAALRYLLEHAMSGQELASRYCVVDSAPTPLVVVEQWLARQLGVDWQGLREGAPAGRGGNKRVANIALLGTGFQLRYPSYREGFAAILADAEG